MPFNPEKPNNLNREREGKREDEKQVTDFEKRVENLGKIKELLVQKKEAFDHLNDSAEIIEENMILGINNTLEDLSWEDVSEEKRELIEEFLELKSFSNENKEGKEQLSKKIKRSQVIDKVKGVFSGLRGKINGSREKIDNEIDREIDQILEETKNIEIEDNIPEYELEKLKALHYKKIEMAKELNEIAILAESEARKLEIEGYKRELEKLYERVGKTAEGREQ